MANLTDLTYFNTDKCVARPECDVLLTSYIVKSEPEILEKTLGYDLMRNYLLGLIGTPSQKWLDLRDGKEYQVDNVYYNWPGMINANKQSFIANYVFYQFSSTGFYSVNQQGIWLASSENSKLADIRMYQVQVYNEMVDLINKMDCFISYQNSVDNTTYLNYNPKTFRKINMFNI